MSIVPLNIDLLNDQVAKTNFAGDGLILLTDNRHTTPIQSVKVSSLSSSAKLDQKLIETANFIDVTFASAFSKLGSTKYLAEHQLTLQNLQYMKGKMTWLASDPYKSTIVSAMGRAIAVQAKVVSQSQPTMYNYMVEFLCWTAGF